MNQIRTMMWALLAAWGVGLPALAQDIAEPPPVLDTPDPVGLTLIASPPPGIFARDTFRIDTVICPFKGDIDYEPGDIECGLLQVPENREDPDSRYIELHFVKLNSVWGKEKSEEEEFQSGLPDGKRDDPIIYLTGGPGARVNYYVERFKDHTILQHRDMYILEQRGIGFSGDFCPFYSTRNPAVQDVETFAESAEASDQLIIDCAVNAAAAGVDVAAYNTIENARDVQALRIALGYERWNVWGISYGSILGQAYVKQDPGGILAVALDAIMPLEIRESELYWRVVHWYERDLQKLQEICQSQPGCAKRYPDIPGRIREAMLSVIDNPIEVEVKDVEAYPSGRARFFQDIVGFLPFVFLYEQANYPALPALVYLWADAVERRDETLFKAIASASGSSGFGGSSDGMRNSILCVDGDVEAQVRASLRDLAEYPVLASIFGSEESIRRDQVICEELDLLQRPAEEYAAVETDIPALIIEGDMDPITPPPNAKAILPGFSRGTYVEFPYAGHGPSRSVTCAGHMLNAFYDDPAAEPDLSCVDEMEEPKMWSPMFATTIAPKLLALMGEDRKKLALPGLWFGLATLIIVIGFFQLTFAPIGRKIEGVSAIDSGGARFLAWSSAALAILSLIVLGAAFAVTSEANEMLLIFGLVPWAKWGAWAGVIGGVVGLLTVVAAFRAHREAHLPFGTRWGLMVTGLGAVAYAAFLLTWGLGPF